MDRAFSSLYREWGGDSEARNQIRINIIRSVDLMEVLAGLKTRGIISEASTVQECLHQMQRVKNQLDKYLARNSIYLSHEILNARRVKIAFSRSIRFLRSLIISCDGYKNFHDDVAITDEHTLYELITFLSDFVQSSSPLIISIPKRIGQR